MDKPYTGSSHCFAIKGVHSAITGYIDLKASYVPYPFCNQMYFPMCTESGNGFIEVRATFIPGDFFTIKVSYADTTDTSRQNNTEFTVRITCPYDYLNTFFKQKNQSHCFEGLNLLRPKYNNSQYKLFFVVSSEINFITHLEIISSSLTSYLTTKKTVSALESLTFTVEFGKTSCLKSTAMDKSSCSKKRLNFVFDHRFIPQGSKFNMPLDWTQNDNEERYVTLSMIVNYYVIEKWEPAFFAAEPQQKAKSPENPDSFLSGDTTSRSEKLYKFKTPFPGPVPPVPKTTNSVPTTKSVPIAPKTTKPIPTSAAMPPPALAPSSKNIPLHPDLAKLVVGSYKSLCEKPTCIEFYKKQTSAKYPKLSDRCKCCSRMEMLYDICKGI